jgi:pSer/pThr/pTyr-binding forkhead associated (FHA) protein
MRLILLALLLCVNVFAQELKLLECNKKNYPDMELGIQGRNPKFMDAKDLKITENNKDVSTFELIPERRDNKYKRAVLILFENSNPPMFTPQREYFKAMLLKTLSESFSPQDVIYFTEFDWVNRKSGKTLTGEMIKKGNAAEIAKLVSAITQPPSNGTQLSLQGQTCLARAVDDGLDFLGSEKLDTTYCKSILLLSGASNDNINSNVDITALVLKARKKNIAINAVDYPRMAALYNTIQLCNETFGRQFRSDNRDVDKYTDSLKAIIKDLSLMASGSYYTLKYKTEVGPGNVAVSLKLSNKTGNESSTLNYNTPSYPGWIFSSVVRILVLLIILGLIIGLAVFFVNKNRKKQQLAKAETEKKLSEIEENNRRAEEENKKNLRDQEEKFRKENEAQRLRQQQEKEMQERKQKDNESLARLQGRNRIPTLVDMSGNVYNLASLVTKIGRIDGNDLVIQDSTVSKNHAVIMYERQSPEAIPVPCNEFFIVDLGSANGTLINNMPISGVYKLKDGDIIRFGNISASFRS